MGLGEWQATILDQISRVIVAVRPDDVQGH